jgi:hypothetical protein
MKRLAMLAIVFCLGLLASSFALADDGGKGKGKKEGSTSTTSTTHGKDKKKCRNVSLKGTVAATTFTITVDKSNKAGRDLKGKSISLKFEGKVNVNAIMCAGDSSTGAAASDSTFQLRNLKVAKPAASEDHDD